MSRQEKNNPPTVSVEGHAEVTSRPARLLMIGRVRSDGQTLALALDVLAKKRDAITQWLGRLAAEEVGFAEPRFPDQVEPDPMRMAQQMAEKRMGRGQASQPTGAAKSVVETYWALWPIESMTPDEILVFVDRIQFESADLKNARPETPQPADWDADPMQQMQAMMANFAQLPDDDEPQFLFLSQLDDCQFEAGVRAAIDDARRKAQTIANAARLPLGELRSLHSVQLAHDAIQNVQQMHRNTAMPVLQETPFANVANGQLSASPQTATFVLRAHAAFEMGEPESNT